MVDIRPPGGAQAVIGQDRLFGWPESAADLQIAEADRCHALAVERADAHSGDRIVRRNPGCQTALVQQLGQHAASSNGPRPAMHSTGALRRLWRQ
jgi:hypothetical protein